MVGRRDRGAAQLHGDGAGETLEAGRAGIVPHRLLPGGRCDGRRPDRHGELVVVMSLGYEAASQNFHRWLIANYSTETPTIVRLNQL